MSVSDLVLHRGARIVDRADLDSVAVPEPTKTWFPISHTQVLDRTLETLGQAGFEVRNTRLALSQDGRRFFGTVDLRAAVATGVNLCVGVRNSVDKSLPIAFCAGHHVFVCVRRDS